MKLDVIYEDNHLLVINKPAGLLSQKDRSGDLDVTTVAKEYLKETYQKPGNVYLGLVHRLDRPVSGVMVLAKTSKAARRLSQAFHDNEVVKEYVALVSGVVWEPGTLNLALKKDEVKLQSYQASDGKVAELAYEPLQIINDKTLVKIKLTTGRFHQIRASFASIGHPIIGDVKYGGPAAKQLCLVSYRLAFKHPVRDEVVSFCLNQLPFES